jgi:taurine dioxygenase
MTMPGASDTPRAYSPLSDTPGPGAAAPKPDAPARQPDAPAPKPEPAKAGAPLSNTKVKMRPMSATTGMEILGVDLRQPLTDAQYREIRRALNDRGVITFRDQDIGPEHQLAFARRFGTVLPVEFLETVPGFPEVGIVAKEPGETRNVGGQWHADHSFDPVPPLGSVLYARELPEYGGDTLFANMATAYDSLSDGMKATLETLRVVHSKKNAAYSDKRAERAPDAKLLQHFAEQAHREYAHPLVARHPDTGRKVLFINANYTARIDGWREDESRALLDTLLAHATRPENTCRFTWAPGSLAFWDNRSANHYALNDYHGKRRIMHRCMLQGSPWREA